MDSNLERARLQFEPTLLLHVLLEDLRIRDDASTLQPSSDGDDVVVRRYGESHHGTGFARWVHLAQYP